MTPVQYQVRWFRVLWIATFWWTFLSSGWIYGCMTHRNCNPHVLATCEP